jgi:hypothetical protein
MEAVFYVRSVPTRVLNDRIRRRLVEMAASLRELRPGAEERPLLEDVTKQRRRP